MKISPASRRLLPWAGAILLSVTVALGIIEVTRHSLEQDYTAVCLSSFVVICLTLIT